ncbi:MAG TPA: DsbA family protein [Acidimicrobiales bacterium]|nr:DsbA family protein [Acidimicrobiales bacterium]
MPEVPRTIEVYADVACPFAHAGLRRFVDERSRRGRPEVVLRARAWPLELVNGRPLDARLVAEEIDELRAHVAPELFAGFDAARFPRTSLAAMALADAAYAVGLEKGERVSLALRDAVFEQGLDVADGDVLARIAADHGVAVPPSDAAVRTDWAEGQARGVVGSPHYFLPGDDFFCPALDVARVDGRLRVRADEAAFSDFLDRCFA